MSTKPDHALTLAAGMGYENQNNAHLFSSDLWLAHQAGRMMQGTGRSRPVDVRKGRGHSIHVNGLTFRYDFKHNHFERMT